MKSLQSIVLSSIVLALVGCATQQKPAASNVATTTVKPAAPAVAKPEKPKVVVKAEAPKAPKAPAAPKAPPVSEFQQVIDALKLQGADLAKYKAAWAAREKAMADFSVSADGKKLTQLRAALTAAKEAKDEAKTKEIQAQIDPLSKKEWDLRFSQRAAVLNALTLAQQQQWAAHLLNNWAVSRAVRRMKYDEAQLKQIRTICDKAAAGFVAADTITKDPYLTTLKGLYPEISKQVTETVLTAEQKATLQPAAAAK